ncbi:MAG: ATP-binding protein [Methanobacteriota archaeon]
MADEASKSRRKPGSAGDPPFPFTGVVGQNALKRGLLLSVVNPRITSLLLSGERDTGKRTAARGLAALLPEMDVAEGCPVSCIPTARERCPACKAASNPKSRVRARMPFVEIPISATIEKLRGGKGNPPRPGLLSKANRGFALMERANLFSEDILKFVLDATENRKVEANGAWPTAITLIATMNDDEGELPEDLRRRFVLRASARSLSDIEERLEIVRRVEAYKAGPAEFAGHHEKESAIVRGKLAAARKLIGRADVPQKVVQAIGRVGRRVGADERAVANLREAAIANATYDGRSWATMDDVTEVVDFALQHQKGFNSGSVA